MFKIWLDTALGRLAVMGVAALVGTLVARGVLPPEVAACVGGALGTAGVVAPSG